jgi:hypothetical protein
MSSLLTHRKGEVLAAARADQRLVAVQQRQGGPGPVPPQRSGKPSTAATASLSDVSECRRARAAPGGLRHAGGPLAFPGSPTYVAETVLGVAACHLGVSPAGAAAIAGELKPLAISQTAMTISCTASGAMRTPSESPNMFPSGGTM